MEHKVLTKILKTIEKLPNQERVMGYGRELSLSFIETPILLQENKNYQIIFKHQTYSFMQHPKNPLAIGIKLWGKKSSKVLIYFNGLFYKKFTIEWKDVHDMNFKKLKIGVKFPDYMTYLERKKWRQEHARLLKNPNLQPTSKYLRCKPDVIFISPN